MPQSESLLSEQATNIQTPAKDAGDIWLTNLLEELESDDPPVLVLANPIHEQHESKIDEIILTLPHNMVIWPSDRKIED